MIAMDLSRRAFIKAQAAAAAAAAANVTLPAGPEHACRARRPAEMVEGALPLLRHRLRRHGRR